MAIFSNFTNQVILVTVNFSNQLTVNQLLPTMSRNNTLKTKARYFNLDTGQKTTIATPIFKTKHEKWSLLFSF